MGKFKELMIADYHVPLATLEKYAENDVEITVHMAKAFKELRVKHDLYNFLRLLGLKTPPKSWRTPIIFKEKS